jgi:hypothetical protein
MNKIEKVKPYQRLQAILSEGKNSSELNLTKKGSDNLNQILGEEDSEINIFVKIKNFFVKIDSKIFTNQSISNRYQKRK